MPALRKPIDDGQEDALDLSDELAHPFILVSSEPHLCAESEAAQDPSGLCIFGFACS